ncbi:hypothetical protein CIK06_12995 [Plantactinospora sp. KBS50]|nr:DUF3152 domain-containing protein [Plantactinospora sp. KBS50]ASW57651.1 hypothetical protein CIK06_12995 [Plantactinospora sp. KBS50]
MPADGTPEVTYPRDGQRRWAATPGSGAVAGSRGRLLRYRVLVERGIAVSPPDFAAEVTRILADPRGWTGAGRWRLQRVGPGARYDFTIYLATPVTRGKLCHSSDRYTSCRYGDAVVLNVARWAHGVPHYGASLAAYREYLVTHEVGHRLGHGHERCPGRGRPAPVMQQQTLGLHGCLANAWPMVDGRRYDGPAGAYADPIPRG